MGNSILRRWSAALLLAGGGLALLLVTGLVPSGFLPWQPATQAQAVEASECKVEYLALDPADQTKVNPNKEVPGAFGPVAESLSDEAIIKKDLSMSNLYYSMTSLLSYRSTMENPLKCAQPIEG